MSDTEAELTLSRVYKLYCPEDPESLIYVGSTLVYLKKRFNEHKKRYIEWKKGECRKYTSCIELFEKYGVNNVEIELLEEVERKSEIRIREKKWIKILKSVNTEAGEFPIETRKIYRLYCPSDSESLIYIGSTAECYKLKDTLTSLKSTFRRWNDGRCKTSTSSNVIFDEYGVDNVKIELIEIVEFRNREDFNKVLIQWIKDLDAYNTYIVEKIGDRLNDREEILEKDYCRQKKEELEDINKEVKRKENLKKGIITKKKFDLMAEEYEDY